MYIGKKSLDAEILIDFPKGVINMNYVLNRFQSDELDSNTSYFTLEGDDEYNKKVKNTYFSISEIIKYRLLKYRFLLLLFLLRFPKIKKRIQFDSQKTTEEYYRQSNGVSEYKKEGRLNTTEFLYHLNNNIWFEYELSGDYEKNIQTIELKRRMVKNTYKSETFHSQDGWNLIFTFSTPPNDGSCIIRYL